MTKNEYIKRSDALELTVYQSMMGLNMAQRKLKDMASEDVVPVIRCRDCDYWEYIETVGNVRDGLCKRFSSNDGESPFHAVFSREFAFCSDAVPRPENDRYEERLFAKQWRML